MKKVSLLMFMLLSLVFNMAQAGLRVDYGPKCFMPTDEVKSPHIEWAKPSVQGKLKVLFIVMQGGMREVIELAERMDLDYTVGTLETSWPNYFTLETCRFGDKATRIADLEEKLGKPYDVIVMGNINWPTLPLTIQYLILKKIKDGTSLVGRIRGTDEYLARATVGKIKPDISMLLPLGGLPAFKQYKDLNGLIVGTLDVSAFGKGRILLLKYSPPFVLQAITPAPMGNPLEVKRVEYDYYLAYIGHLLYWAANRPPPITINGQPNLQAARDKFKSMEFTLGSRAETECECVFMMRSPDNEIMAAATNTVKLAPGETKTTFDVGSMPAGKYYADLWVRTGGKVAEYGSVYVEVVGDTVIEAVKLQKSFTRNEPVKGTVTVAAKSGLGGLALDVRRIDNYGRLTGRTLVEIGKVKAGEKKEIAFAMASGIPLSILQYVDVELLKDSDILDRMRSICSISDLYPPDDIRYVIWGGCAFSYPLYTMFEEFARGGFDSHYTGFTECVPLANMWHIPYATRLIDLKITEQGVSNRSNDDHVRTPCLSDPEYLKQESEKLKKVARQVQPYSTREFSFGDEDRFANTGVELCFSPTCVARFHRFLKDEYGTVAVMNKEYESNYQSFEAVRPITIAEVKKTPNLRPLWVDYRRHMENTWAGAIGYFGDVVREIVPEAKTGYEGSDTMAQSWYADDYYKLMNNMRLNNLYDGAFAPYAIKDFSQPGTLLGLGWFGGYGSCSGDCQRYTVWRLLFRGANSYWVWFAYPEGPGTMMAPDLSYYDYFKASNEEIGEIKSGIGKLFMNATRENDEIGILYSASSVHVGTLTEGLPSMDNVLKGIVPLFEDTRHQFRIIAYEQLARGELRKGGYKFLWMPYVQALSRKEAVAVEAFVREGGTVVADLRPGVSDEHGKPYAGGGILDKVFGVNQRTEGPIATNCEATINLEGYAKTLKKMTCDWSVRLSTGEAKALLGQGPALIDYEKRAVIINQYGKGKAILLNFSLSAYVRQVGSLENSAVKAGDDSGDIRELFKTLMSYVGIKEKLKPEPELEGLRLYRHQEGPNEFLGILQELPEDPSQYFLNEAKPLKISSTKITFPGKRHVYDMRAGKYLGYRDALDLKVKPAHAQLYGLLPYQVTGVEIHATQQLLQGDSLDYEVRLRTSGGAPGLHVGHVMLIGPDGKERKHYSGNILISAGKGQGKVSLALDDEKGTWKLIIKDVISGMVDEHQFKLEAKP